MPKLLIIDDDDAVRESLAETLIGAGFEVEEAASGGQGLGVLAARAIDDVFLDLRMPGMSGLELLKQVRQAPRRPPVVVLTAHATAENTIEAMRLGAFDHLTKPIARADLLAVAARLCEVPLAVSPSEPSAFDGMVGVSSAMREVQKLIGRVADSKATVLITGETGTGKEVVAQTIHRFGNRAARSFVAVNCAAIPADLMESELFGHVRGAFTGAASDRAGAFGEADGGILFLDEIGDMPLAMQAKMLRVLQEGVVSPVGGRPRTVDVRVIAATHRTLADWVTAGHFRQDLLYRLNVMAVHIPPLRERPEDIAPLASHFLREAEGGRKSLRPDAEALLRSFAWPGNVRQLKNAVIRAATLATSASIGAQDFAFLAENSSMAASEQPAQAADLPGAIEQLEVAMIGRAIEAAGGNRAAAARRLNIPRQQLYVKLRKYGIACRDS
jgi:two-component system NtrC family response regulator